MGNFFSSTDTAKDSPTPPPPPPPPASLLEQPWRHIGRIGQPVTWNEERAKALREKCLQCDLDLPKGQQVRILMMGATGSGKSSFINSFYAALTDEIKEYAFAARASDKSVTKFIYNPFLRIGKKEPYFRILDSPGILESDDKFYKQFVEYALKGHLKEDVEYEPLQIPTDDKHFVKQPGKLDRPCLVVFVIKPSGMDENGETKKKLEIAKELASRNGIKLAVVVTKADLVSEEEKYPLKNENTQNIFRSAAALKGVNETISYTGLQTNRIFPVTNYTEQMETCTEMNILLLYTLSKLLDDAKLEAESRLQRKDDQEEEDL